MKDGDFIKINNSNLQKENPFKNTFQKLIKEKEDLFDSQYGGFTEIPKSPAFFNLYSLLKIASIKDSHVLLEMIEKTLLSLYQGGIFDHIGFGFSTYSMDKKWLIPNFEKNLSTNASALLAYSEAFKITKNLNYKEIAYKIILYINNNLKNHSYTYYSSESFKSSIDAENFYSLSYEEFSSILGEDSSLFSIYYDVTKEGNFKGKNILNLIDRDLELNEFFDDKREIIRKKLFEYREKKFKPTKDSKIRLDWNALMIASLAYASRAFNDLDLLKKAEKNLNYLLDNCYDNKVFINTLTLENSNLDCYAFIIFALLECYKSSKNITYLNKAISLSNEAISLFYDDINYGFFFKEKKENSLSEKYYLDKEFPSGNSMMLFNLIELNKLENNPKYLEIIKNTLFSIAVDLNENPTFYETMLTNILIK